MNGLLPIRLDSGVWISVGINEAPAAALSSSPPDTKVPLEAAEPIVVFANDLLLSSLAAGDNI
ncbi:hypothetical protein D3C80_1979620 [compost metagenome]